MTQSKYIMNKTKYEMVIDIRKTKKCSQTVQNQTLNKLLKLNLETYKSIVLIRTNVLNYEGLCRNGPLVKYSIIIVQGLHKRGWKR